MIRSWSVVLFLVVVILLPAQSHADQTSTAPAQRVTVDLEGRMLSDVLAEISATTGVEFLINAALDRPLRGAISDQPIELAIKGMIRPSNHAFIYDGGSLRTVKIFGKSAEEATTKITPRSAASGKSTTGTAAATAPTVRPPGLTKEQLQAIAREKGAGLSEEQLKQREANRAEREARRQQHAQRRAEREAAKKQRMIESMGEAAYEERFSGRTVSPAKQRQLEGQTQSDTQAIQP